MGEDTIVRVGAREVRKRLAQYYVTPEAATALVLIELPSGSYAPEFRYAAAVRNLASAEPAQEQMVQVIPQAEFVASEATIAPGPEPAMSPGPSGASRGVKVALAGLALAVLGVVAFARWSADPREKAFQRFWAPVLQSGDSLVIGVGHPIVYQPSRRASLLSANRTPVPPSGMQSPIELAPQEMDGSDMVPVMNQFVGFGDMVAANEVSQMLARRSHPVRALLASSIPFADLRHSQAYLIGSFSNRWTMELQQSWRFQFRWTPDHLPSIIDIQSKDQRRWTTPAKDDGSTPEDYSLVARIRKSPTGGLLIVSAGIKQFGTEAAGRLLADPVELGTILNRLPAGWEDKNLELVLHNRVIGNTSAQPEVVASYVW